MWIRHPQSLPDPQSKKFPICSCLPHSFIHESISRSAYLSHAYTPDVFRPSLKKERENRLRHFSNPPYFRRAFVKKKLVNKSLSLWVWVTPCCLHWLVITSGFPAPFHGRISSDRVCLCVYLRLVGFDGFPCPPECFRTRKWQEFRRRPHLTVKRAVREGGVCYQRRQELVEAGALTNRSLVVLINH